ncbi:S8/S53 family peptidase [Cellulomonas humilata]|uniref:Subtilisin family serine protease n=1 Tax=Cellulomonas humilata TaxID=144055 RepID=A0ABU0EH63_9CELL|nr:S8/S53 family peptidase [Cellulomonas humilata]MDQ0374606.1 subtilisin family serine protease [Cellulomonas humilata]
MKLLAACALGDTPSPQLGASGGWDEIAVSGPSDTSYLAADVDGASRREAWDAAYELISQDQVSWAGVEGIVSPGHPLAEQAVGVTPSPRDPAWARERMRQPEALTLLPARPDRVVIGHPDTGWARHRQLPTGSLDLARARNAFTGGIDAEDPVESIDPFDGHGTGTASLLVSSPDDHDLIRPRTRDPVLGYGGSDSVVPVRCATNVVQFSTVALVWSINYLTSLGVDVISISLGGLPSPALHAALRRAVERNVVVVAAGGQRFPVVPYPAAYTECIAVAASAPDDRPWGPTTASRSIDISAPGHLVAVADFAPPGITEITKAGSGTSYAAPAVAAAAALWIARWGRSTLLDRYRDAQPLQLVFRELLQKTARAPEELRATTHGDADPLVAPTSWRTDRYGAGIVDMAALLSAPLPAPVPRRPAPPISPQQHDLAALGHTLGVSPEVAALTLDQATTLPHAQRPVSAAETVDILFSLPADTLSAIRRDATQLHIDGARAHASGGGGGRSELAGFLAESLKPILDAKGSASLQRSLA